MLKATINTLNAVIPNIYRNTSANPQQPATPAVEVKRSPSPIKQESGTRVVKKVKRETDVVDLTD